MSFHPPGSPDDLRDQVHAFGAQVAPFVEHYVASWTPYRGHWNYEDGCVFKGCLDLADATRQRFLRDFVYREVSTRIAPDGAIAGFDADELNIDNLNAGKALFRLLEQTGESRFRLAIEQQYEQLVRHPRTHSGNYWHKKIYPRQVWLDGLYMAQPFQLAHARASGDEKLAADSVRQFANVRATLRDARSGLYYHGWDESRQERWSNAETGCSPCFWARAMGWFLMALVDSLEIARADVFSGVAGIDELRTTFSEAATALVRVRSDAGLWWQVLDRAGQERNYEECSASLMIAYGLMKGARLGLLSEDRGRLGLESLQACIRRFLTQDTLNGICAVAGLGGTPYRDGSYAYYVSEPIVANDPKGVGALLMALAEGQLRRTGAKA